MKAFTGTLQRHCTVTIGNQTHVLFTDGDHLMTCPEAYWKATDGYKRDLPEDRSDCMDGWEPPDEDTMRALVGAYAAYQGLSEYSMCTQIGEITGTPDDAKAAGAVVVPRDVHTPAELTLIESDRVADGERMPYRRAIVSHPQYGRLYIAQGFGGLHNLEGGCFRWRHGYAAQIPDDHTIADLERAANDAMITLDQYLIGRASGGPRVDVAAIAHRVGLGGE
jgi:hypothetical protein